MPSRYMTLCPRTKNLSLTQHSNTLKYGTAPAIRTTDRHPAKLFHQNATGKQLILEVHQNLQNPKSVQSPNGHHALALYPGHTYAISYLRSVFDLNADLDMRTGKIEIIITQIVPSIHTGHGTDGIAKNATNKPATGKANKAAHLIIR